MAKKGLKVKNLEKKKMFLIIVGILVVVLFMLLATGFSGNITGQAKYSVSLQCSDRLDNDGDGYCDFLSNGLKCLDGSVPGDLDCSSKSDNKEMAECSPIPERCDGYDNDCDGDVDESLSITCASAASCGTSGWTGSSYCGTDGNVYRDYRTYLCSFPSTCSSSCSSITNSFVQSYCSSGCSNGSCLNLSA